MSIPPPPYWPDSAPVRFALFPKMKVQQVQRKGCRLGPTEAIQCEKQNGLDMLLRERRGQSPAVTETLGVPVLPYKSIISKGAACKHRKIKHFLENRARL